jgi:hypothetical protein
MPRKAAGKTARRQKRESGAETMTMIVLIDADFHPAAFARDM